MNDILMLSGFVLAAIGLFAAWMWKRRQRKAAGK
jgi:LPXTG-motif cell wall-anchored protein